FPAVPAFASRRRRLAPRAGYDLYWARDLITIKPSAAESGTRAQLETNLKPSPQRVIRPVDGEGKCAMHISVDESQRRPNTFRRDSPACLGSKSARMPR